MDDKEAVIMAKLKAPFPAEDIEWRIQQSGVKNGKPWGKVLAYVDARAIQDRLDEVFGVFGWEVKYTETKEGYLCGIGVYTDSGHVVKWDGAGQTQIEAVKGGISSALKRAGSCWGIGRYLYNLSEGWANFVDNGKYSAKIDGEFYKWNPPALPAWALPDNAVVQGFKFAIDHLKDKEDAKKWVDKNRKELEKLPEGDKAEIREYYEKKESGLK